jgi:hypothetical protein
VKPCGKHDERVRERACDGEDEAADQVRGDPRVEQALAAVADQVGAFQ